MHNTLGSVLATLCLSVIAAAGCAEAPVGESIDDAVQTIVHANQKVETATFDLTLAGTVRTESEMDTSEVLLTGTGTGAVDNTTHRMHLSMTVRIKTPGQPAIDLLLHYFLADEWLYMGSSAPGDKLRWMKVRAPEGMWHNQAHQQIEMLRSANEISYLGMEDVDGVTCHVVRIMPDAASVQQIVLQTYGQLAPLGLHNPESIDLANVEGEVSVIQYVAAESHMFVRTDQQMVLEAIPFTAPVPEESSERITHRLATTVVFGNYNEPVTIQMPQGSLAAIEIGQSH